MTDTNNINASPGAEIPVDLQLPVKKTLHPFTIQSEQCTITFYPRFRFIARFLQALVGIEWRVK